jgi:hypothetical protein
VSFLLDVKKSSAKSKSCSHKNYFEKKTLILIFFLLYCFCSKFSQFGTISWAGDLPKSEGFSINSNSGVIFAELGFKSVFYDNVFQGGMGFNFEFGLNPGILIRPGTIIAPFVGIGGLWGLKYQPEFVKQVNRYYQPARLLQLQSQTNKTPQEMDELASLQEGDASINCIRSNEIHGSMTIFSFGVVLKYPHLWAPPIKLYGILRSTETGKKSSSLIYAGGGGQEPGYYHLECWGWGTELYLFRGYALISGDTGIGNICIGSISLYYEQMDFKNATLVSDLFSDKKSVYLRDFVNPNFFKSYKYEYVFGIKISLSVM